MLFLVQLKKDFLLKVELKQRMHRKSKEQNSEMKKKKKLESLYHGCFLIQTILNTEKMVFGTNESVKTGIFWINVKVGWYVFISLKYFISIKMLL